MDPITAGPEAATDGTAKESAPAKDADGYLAALPPEARATLKSESGSEPALHDRDAIPVAQPPGHRRSC